MTRLPLAGLLTALLVSGCACPDAYGTKVSTCIEVEELDFVDENGDGFDDNGEVVGIAGATGRIVDRDFRAVPQGLGDCRSDLRHVVALDPEDGARRVKISWEHADADLDVDFVGEQLSLEDVATSWGGNFSFVLRDDDGVALAVSGELGLSSVGDATIEHGGWRGSTLSACGISSVSGTRITTADATHDIGNGESVDVVVDDQNMRFHAFSSFTFGPVWACTDTNNRLSWALVRPGD